MKNKELYHYWKLKDKLIKQCGENVLKFVWKLQIYMYVRIHTYLHAKRL